ncbi:hypothetical protein QLS71_005130 [Mariniflexile litorale]|uniref:ABC-2 family transporter n=1 Tax=Mariniflexile litorale TaxID=3045158 RepID=A0AAU7EH29_9FLAO|nr:hypothetical protein [Mariniflexile sp. KMM 9835]MDQ8210957.1 hypothetical protein [Mariniflexile sp. KMM 9835]
MFQNYFNIKRFNNAFRYDIKLYTKTYLSFCIGLFLILICIDLFFIKTNSNSSYGFGINQYLPLFYFTFIVGLIIVVGTSFPLLKNKKSAISYLMLPASVFEKFLIQFVIRIVCFVILFIPLFWLNFKIADSFSNLFEWGLKIQVGEFELFEAFKISNNGFRKAIDLIAALGGLFTLAAFLFTGATYFKKYALFKTILSFSATIAFVFLLFMVCTMFFFPEKFDLGRSPVNLEDYRISKHFINIQLYIYIMGIVSSFFLLPLAYFKLKEKEL